MKDLKELSTWATNSHCVGDLRLTVEALIEYLIARESNHGTTYVYVPEALRTRAESAEAQLAEMTKRAQDEVLNADKLSARIAELEKQLEQQRFVLQGNIDVLVRERNSANDRLHESRASIAELEKERDEARDSAEKNHALYREARAEAKAAREKALEEAAMQATAFAACTGPCLADRIRALKVTP